MSEINKSVSLCMSKINMHYEQSMEASTEAATKLDTNTYTKLDTKMSVNSDESNEEPSELAAEQNWRNKNDEKAKRAYLDAILVGTRLILIKNMLV